MQILIVEDEPVLRSFLVDVLSDRADVVAVTSAAAALTELEHDRFDVVLAGFDLGAGSPSGQWLLDRVALRHPGPRRILVCDDEVRTLEVRLSESFAVDDLLSVVGLAARESSGVHDRVVADVPRSDAVMDVAPPTTRRPRLSYGAGLRALTA